ncbi:MAG: hypothetical protein ACOZIN_12270 [Myxococcota bacterium]
MSDRILRFLCVVLAFSGLALVGCQCGEPPPVTDDAGGGAEEDGGGGGGFDGGACTRFPNGASCTANSDCCSDQCDAVTRVCTTGAGTCFGLGATCNANIECCGGKTCAPDATGTKHCTDTSFCAANGAACTAPSQCCSLSCGGCTPAADGGQDCTCQGSGSLCQPEGTGCGSNVECCSSQCNTTCLSSGAGCKTLGERCATPGYDANCCSKYCVDFGGDAGANLRCAQSSTCRARGEICTLATDCCAGVCDNGRCPSQAQLGQKLFVGEPCVQDSDCASYACASTVQGGPKLCQFLGGCRPAEETCTDDYQCCGYLELSQSRDQCTTAQPVPGVCTAVAGVPGLKRCTLQPTDKEVGEICKSGTMVVHACCGGEAVCRPTITGVSRCFGGALTPDAGCLSNGTSCSIADQCCSRICAPGTSADGGLGLFCRGCVTDGNACTTSNDCCSLVCTNGVCGATVDGGATCVPLGGACTTNAQCCSTICSSTDGGPGTCSTVGIN